jgi:hypothetical protein
MSHQLISHSPDLKQLRDEGYEIEIRNGYLIVHHIPYVNSSKEVKYGKLTSELTLKNNLETSAPSTHVVNFSGEHPCNNDGSIIGQIQHASNTQVLAEGLIINHSFSNKPKSGYRNYYEKMTRYIEMISAPAMSLDPTVSAKTFKLIPEDGEDDVFEYLDTNSSRANIVNANSKFRGLKIAVVGLGGTGAYILDLLSKTPVREIHLFDGDKLLQHNAFRYPGAIAKEELEKGLTKVEFLKDKYSKLKKNIVSHPYYLIASNLLELAGMDYVFVCVDKNSARMNIINYLVEQKTSFIDVGLGVNLIDDLLIGTVRVTAGTSTKSDHLSARIPGEDNDNNEYSTNIQIADLNCLNAVLAIIKWKKMVGFYQDLEEEHHCSYSINVAQLLNEDLTS